MRSEDLALVSGWLLLLVVALATRPLLPIDETRYLSVAWEMWLRGSFLVPLLNGEPYSHKPPLLFWLIHAGWWLFGVQEWWGRVVAPLFGHASLFAARQLARTQRPEAVERARLVPWLLLGCLSWTLFTTLTMFDMLVALFAIVGVWGVVESWRGRVWRGFVMVALGLGLGALAKGPVILVYVLPPALLAPVWMRPTPPRWTHYYARLAGAVAAAAVIALSWALQAGAAGGADYRAAILWGQTAGRIGAAFSHQQPFWWYLPVLPALLFPWTVWPQAWRGVSHALRDADAGVRLALVWLLGGVLILSLISGKQPHYLLPLFPSLALLLAAGLGAPVGRWSTALPSAIVVAAGVALAGLSHWLHATPDTSTAALGLPTWAHTVSTAAGGGVVAVGLVVASARVRTARAAVIALAAQSVAVVVTIHALAVEPVAHAYDLERIARYIRGLERSDTRIGMLGRYDGQFAFLGRLERPLQVIPPWVANDWFEADDRRRLIVVMPDAPPDWVQAEYAQLYRGQALAIVDNDTWDAYLTFASTHPDSRIVDRMRGPGAAADTDLRADPPE
jgi:4-amino-4-deoxy-L-arabinose transferase-like glycosyltransferase